jgi:hypothetical protein
MEMLGGERRKVLDDYIAVTWIPNRGKLQRHHRMEVRSTEENTVAAAEHEHSSNKKYRDSVKHHHGIAKTALTLENNSRKRNGEKRQEEAEASESHALWASSETVDVVTMFAEVLNMRQYDERRHYQSVRVSLTKWFLRCIRDKEGLLKETEEDAPLKYAKFDRV